MCNVVIIGAGGHAKVVADIVIKRGDTLLGFLDDHKTGEVLDGYRVLGKVDTYASLAQDAVFIIAIGDNATRQRLAQTLPVKWYTAIHPSAQIGTGSYIGEGTCVMANAVVNAAARVGEHCILNTASVVEHDCVLGDYVHISPGAVLCGTVTLGDGIHVGANATVINNLSICSHTVIGASAAVVRDITCSGVYVGVPARKCSARSK